MSDSRKKSQENVAKNTALMSSATLISRVTGFLRTWACAFALGNTLLTSAYQIANSMPNMLYELVAGGLLSTAFLPVYLAQREKKGGGQANDYVSNILSIFLLILGIIVLLATFFAPQVIFTQTFMTNGEDAEMATWFFRFFAIQILFYGVSAVVGGVLNANKKYLWPALGPVFNNVVVIITMFAFVPLSASNPQFAKVWLAVGTSLGIFVQMAVQIPALFRQGFRFRFHIDFHDEGLRETARLALPAIIFTVINLICVSVRTACALKVTPLGASALSYAWLWYQLPYGVLGVALSTAMFTEMSESAAKHEMLRFRGNVRSGLRATFFLIIPMAVLLGVLADMLITLYHAGAFTASDISMVAELLRRWAICLPFYAAYMYLYFSFSSLKDLKTVTWANLGASIVQVVLYLILSSGIGSWPGFGLNGIPLSDTAFFIIMFLLLSFLLRKKVGEFGFLNIAGLAIMVLLISALGGGVAFGIVCLMGPTQSIPGALIRIVVAGGAGLIVIFLLAKLLRIKEYSIVSRLLLKIGGKLGIKSAAAKAQSIDSTKSDAEIKREFASRSSARTTVKSLPQGKHSKAAIVSRQRGGSPSGKHSK